MNELRLIWLEIGGWNRIIIIIIDGNHTDYYVIKFKIVLPRETGKLRWQYEKNLLTTLQYRAVVPTYLQVS